jgi:hypothetical protein
LLSGANHPLLKNKEDLISHWASIDEISEFNTGQFSEQFDIALNKDVYRLELKNWSEGPHFAAAYYDEKKRTLFKCALNETGYDELSKALSKLNLSPEADTHVAISMVITTEKILNKKMKINPYEGLFEKTVSEKEQESTAMVNKFMQLALPYFNEKREPDLDALAKEAGIDIENARSLWAFLHKQMKAKI